MNCENPEKFVWSFWIAGFEDSAVAGTLRMT